MALSISIKRDQIEEKLFCNIANYHKFPEYKSNTRTNLALFSMGNGLLYLHSLHLAPHVYTHVAEVADHIRRMANICLHFYERYAIHNGKRPDSEKFCNTGGDGSDMLTSKSCSSHAIRSA